MHRNSATEDLADRLHSTAIHLLRLVRGQDAAAGVGPAQLSALSVLVFAGARSLNELARAEQVRPPTMSRIVDALEAQGLARRRPNQQDRRALLIEATEKGGQVLKSGRKRRVKFLAARLRRLSAAELMQIENAIQAIQKLIHRRS
jgi:DNA-binding MarR family transcriptional regulator